MVSRRERNHIPINTLTAGNGVGDTVVGGGAGYMPNHPSLLHRGRTYSAAAVGRAIAVDVEAAANASRRGRAAVVEGTPSSRQKAR